MEYVQLYPEYDFIFLGDNGQGDAMCADRVIEKAGQPCNSTLRVCVCAYVRVCGRANLCVCVCVCVCVMCLSVFVCLWPNCSVL